MVVMISDSSDKEKSKTTLFLCSQNITFKHNTTITTISISLTEQIK